METKNLLIWEKWRPKSLEEIILLPRIRKNFELGVKKNYIFHGSYGTGKTTLARILIGKYTKDKAYLEINSSLHTSIDILRDQIEKFCKTVPIMETDDPIKYVFLDEAERISQQYQDALKAFIEKYHSNVRFIITTNHIGKISDGIKSRFTQINFDCQNQEEEIYLKKEMYKKITEVISPKENISIDKENLIKIINKRFPDLRGVMVDLQNFSDVGPTSQSENSISHKLKMDLYTLISNNSDYESVYHFVMEKFGPEKIDLLISILERDFIEWSIKEKKENLKNMFKFNKIISEYKPKLESSLDPIVLGMSIIGEFKELSSNI
jgi:DNA polymerase III delta prime subunit